MYGFYSDKAPTLEATAAARQAGPPLEAMDAADAVSLPLFLRERLAWQQQLHLSCNLQCFVNGSHLLVLSGDRFFPGEEGAAHIKDSLRATQKDKDRNIILNDLCSGHASLWRHPKVIGMQVA